MICVEVLVNGEPACAADGYLTFLNLLVHSGQYNGNPNRLLVTGFVDGVADLAPRLLAAMQKQTDNQQFRWLDRNIEVGDEITIRIIDRPELSPPPTSNL